MTPGMPSGHPLAAARTWLAAGRPVALATVIDTWGSALVRAGGQMAIAGPDEFQGSVSGGPAEEQVIAAALDVIANGRPQLLKFGIEDDAAQRAGLACGGQIRIHVARLDPNADRDLVDRLTAALAQRQRLVTRLGLADGSRTILDGDDLNDPEIADALRRGRSAVDASGETFLHVLAPAPRIIIVGATEIAQHLTSMAIASGYDVTVIDPRAGYANSNRFPGALLLSKPPSEAMMAAVLDSYTAVVTLTHVDQIDDDALTIALKSSCRYIGSLGSRRTHAKRVARLQAAGFSDGDFARIHAPVGMNIAAETPGEIATSILAEIIAAFRKPQQSA